MLSRAQKLQALLELVREDSSMRECIHRIASAVIPQKVRIAECTEREAGFQALKPELAQFLDVVFARFLAAAFESLLVCGFVVFVVRRETLHDTVVDTPVALPLGSFTWDVRPVSKDTSRRLVRNNSLYYYEITCLHHDFKAPELNVSYARDPEPNIHVLPSRLDGLLSEFLQLRNFETMTRRIDEWNSMKHITTSETVNIPRDQTTDGISLLDDFRRYIMSGQHSGISTSYMVSSAPGESVSHQDPSNIAHSWIRDFSFAKESDSACVHLMPPNTTISELGPLELKHDRDEVYKRFRKHVMGFFEMTPFEELRSQSNSTFAVEVQMTGMRRLSSLCERLLEDVYAQIFGIPVTDVKVSMRPPVTPQCLLTQHSPKRARQS